MKRFTGAVLALAGLVGLSACSASHQAADPNHLKVVATTTQICDYVKNIEKSGGADLDLTCLLAPNASAHDHEMTSQQMAALGKADVLLVNGVDLEHFLDQAVESSGFKGTMAVTSGKLSSAPTKTTGKFQVAEGSHKVDVAPWPFAPEPGEEAEFEFDPHVWTSPRGAAQQVRNIAEALDNAAGKGKVWQERTENYATQLEELDKWVSASVGSVPREKRVLFTSHDAFGYFARDYDVKFVGAALSDFNAQQDATAEHLNAGVQQVKDAKASVIFAENSNNAKSIEAIGRAAGVRVITGEDALYGDSLGPAGTDGETYVGSILHNVTNLVRAWGGTTADIPSSLQAHAPKEVVS
ncbi:metal ABC transporter substrate-binding protein [Staphylococcus chromogenes]|nr:metal ABC transporter substrate-binding protein [Staphylococcus chromogenes]